jgi:hypothetical protein
METALQTHEQCEVVERDECCVAIVRRSPGLGHLMLVMAFDPARSVNLERCRFAAEAGRWETVLTTEDWRFVQGDVSPARPPAIELDDRFAITFPRPAAVILKRA